MCLINAATIAGGRHKIRQVIATTQQQLNKLGVKLQPVGTHLVKDGFKFMGKRDQLVQAESTCAPFDRVNRPEDSIDHLRVVIASFDSGQTLIHCFEEFFALLKECVLYRPRHLRPRLQ